MTTYEKAKIRAEILEYTELLRTEEELEESKRASVELCQQGGLSTYHGSKNDQILRANKILYAETVTLYLEHFHSNSETLFEEIRRDGERSVLYEHKEFFKGLYKDIIRLSQGTYSQESIKGKYYNLIHIRDDIESSARKTSTVYTVNGFIVAIKKLYAFNVSEGGEMIRNDDTHHHFICNCNECKTYRAMNSI